MAQRITAFAAFLSFVAFVSSAGVKCPGTANYTLTFRALWKLDRHPNTALPNNAHFSSLVGCTHGADYVMWRAGTKASPGVESVAERGDTATLKNEINAQIAAQKVWQLILPGGTGAVGEITGIHVQVTSNFSKVSFITMLAPSPDWFIGIDSFDMCDNGKWRESWNDTMSPPYDAGTEEGEGFSTGNPASNPHVDIFRITNDMQGAFKNTEPIKSLGEFLFKAGFPQATSFTMTPQSTAAMPTTESSVRKSSASFAVLVSATLILALLF